MQNDARQKFFQLLGLVQTGRLKEAEAGLTKALRTAPNDPNLLHLAAQNAENLGDKPRAVALYRRALAAHPGWLEATFNLARLLDRKESIPLLKELSQSHPNRADVFETLARFEQAEEKLPEAAEHWRRALALRPDNPAGLGQYYLCCRSLCYWREEPKPDPALGPQIAVVLFDDPLLQKQAAQLYCARRFSSIKPLPRPPVWKHEGLRVGYLSSDFHAHATSRLMAELFSLHDRTRFEIFVYSYGVDDGSDLRGRIKNGAEHFIELGPFTPLQCAQKIREDQIDVLIDLKGHTSGGRLDILAHRPAPVQAHWLGFPGTTGAAFIDLFIGDSTVVPVGAEDHFTEKVVRLPHAYQINDRQRQVAPPLDKIAYGLPETGLVLASFNQTYKLTPEMFDVWCAILKELPNAVLWLYESNPYAPDHLRREAETRGINPARLVFAGPLPHEEHLARYEIVDIALDTFPVCGHTTTSDALWTGAPVVTMEGKSFVSRVAASLLRAAELPSLITSSPEEYKRRVLDLARNKAAIEAIRQHLKNKRGALPLFDTPRLVKDLESLLLAQCPAGSNEE